MSEQYEKLARTTLNIFILSLLLVLYSPEVCVGLILQPHDAVCCPNTTVTLRCSASLVFEMEWDVESCKFLYLVNQLSNESKTKLCGNFLSEITSFKRENTTTATFMELTIVTNCSEIQNLTQFNCSVSFGGIYPKILSATVYHASIPRLLDRSNGASNFTAVLDLEEMFDGGGVPIDYYIIQLDNGTRLETVNSTYSFDIMYNTTLSVNISAHNCAGYSPFFPLVIQYRPGEYVPMEGGNLNNNTAITVLTDVINDPTMLTNGSNTQNKQATQYTFLLPVSMGSVVLIIFVLVIIVFLFNMWKCVKKRSVKSMCLTRIENNQNTEHDSEGASTLPLYSYVPVQRSCDCTGQYHTVTNSVDTSQNFIGMYAEVQPTGMYTEVEPSQPAGLQPPPVENDTVEYTLLDVSKLMEMEKTKEEPVEENIAPTHRKDDLHPLDKEINTHLILLQLGAVRESWHALGVAAGMESEMLQLVNDELSDNSGKLAEVVFYWVKRMKKVYWSDVAQLCEEIGFNQISEAINNAYITGVLPVQDTPDVAPCTTEATLPPTLSPHISDDNDDEKGPPVPPHQGRRRGNNTVVPTMVLQDEMSVETLSCDREYDEGSPPPPPLPPPLASGDIDF